MIRKFLPVGQGAFYLEQFPEYVPEGGGRINVVYDCGSLSGIHLVHNQIDRCFSPNEKIQAVFLSHFDKDHVNGLEYLLKHYQVEHIFFPLLTTEDKAFIRLRQLVKRASADEHAFWLRFALDPSETLSQMGLEYVPTLHPVSSGDSDDEDPGLYNTAERPYPWPRVQVVPSGANVFDTVRGFAKGPAREADWFYIPFNFRETENREILKIMLNKALGTRNPEELLELLKDEPSSRAAIKKAYGKVPGTLNSNSMTLFSGTKSEHLVGILDSPRCLCGGCYCMMADGVLYLGDYEASGQQKWTQLEKAYHEYFPFTGCLQVPHHGSKDNFNPKLLELEACRLYFISAGVNNKHKHPDGGVIKQIMLSGKCPSIVTEQPWSEITMSIAL